MKSSNPIHGVGLPSFIRVFVGGRALRIRWTARVSDLFEELGLSEQTHIAVVNGRPAPRDLYLQEGDDIMLLEFTTHEELGGSRLEEDL